MGVRKVLMVFCGGIEMIGIKNKIIYICHQYGGKPENKEQVTKLVKGLVQAYPDYCFLSPIHSTGFLYHDLPYNDGMESCLSLLNVSSELWCFGNKSMSRGCMIEKDYCKRYKIPIVERGEYIE